MAKSEAKRIVKTIRWVEICHGLFAMGLMEDFSKGECLRVATALKKRVEQGKVTKLKRGLYQIETYGDANLLIRRRMKALGPTTLTVTPGGVGIKAPRPISHVSGGGPSRHPPHNTGATFMTRPSTERKWYRYSAKERAILSVLSTGAGKKFTSTELIEKVYGDEQPLHARSALMTIIGILIQKVEKNEEPFRIARTTGNGPSPHEFWKETRS